MALSVDDLWHDGIAGHSNIVTYDGDDIRSVGTIPDAAKRRRAIECVNALQGVDTATLRSDILAMLPALVNRLVDLRGEVDMEFFHTEAQRSIQHEIQETKRLIAFVKTFE